MGLADKLGRVGGILKNRLASAIGALRGIAARVPAPIRRIARLGRLGTPAGIGLAALGLLPQIRRGLVVGRQAVTRGIAFVGGQRVTTAALAGTTVGVLGGRKGGKPDPIIPRAPGIKAKEARITTRRRPTKKRAPARAKPRKRKRIPAHGHRVISVRRPRKRKAAKRRTHRSPRHRGHTRVKFTTKSGQKVSFLANPKARHR